MEYIFSIFLYVSMVIRFWDNRYMYFLLVMIVLEEMVQITNKEKKAKKNEDTKRMKSEEKIMEKFLLFLFIADKPKLMRALKNNKKVITYNTLYYFKQNNQNEWYNLIEKFCQESVDDYFLANNLVKGIENLTIFPWDLMWETPNISEVDELVKQNYGEEFPAAQKRIEVWKEEQKFKKMFA